MEARCVAGALCVAFVAMLGAPSCGNAPDRAAPPGERATADRAQSGPAAVPVTPPATERTTIDMNAIFPPGPGRDIVLNSCQNCHTFVPIVILQMDEQAWTRNSRDHRMRVSAMSDADFETAYEYLKKNFNPGRPVPRLPKELLESWTTS